MSCLHNEIALFKTRAVVDKCSDNPEERWRNGGKSGEGRRNEHIVQNPNTSVGSKYKGNAGKKWSGGHGGGTRQRRRAIKPEPWICTGNRRWGFNRTIAIGGRNDRQSQHIFKKFRLRLGLETRLSEDRRSRGGMDGGDVIGGAAQSGGSGEDFRSGAMMTVRYAEGRMARNKSGEDRKSVV